MTIILTFPLFAFAQKRTTTVVVPSTPSDVTIKTPVPQMEKGSVEGRTYKNASIGLELTVADGLEFQTPELKGTTGTLPLLVTVTAWRQEGLLSPRKVTAFYADALAYYPEGQRSTDAYMAKVIKGNRQTGYEPVESALRGCLSKGMRRSSIRIYLRQFEQRHRRCTCRSNKFETRPGAFGLPSYERWEQVTTYSCC